jgi:large subunit ribosomal protein L31
MKKGIHPETKLVTVTCACGETFETLSVRDEIKVEICSKCHPFFTGQRKIVDTAGRVEKFMKRAAKAKSEEELKKRKKKKH